MRLLLQMMYSSRRQYCTCSSFFTTSNNHLQKPLPPLSTPVDIRHAKKNQTPSIITNNVMATTSAAATPSSITFVCHDNTSRGEMGGFVIGRNSKLQKESHCEETPQDADIRSARPPARHNKLRTPLGFARVTHDTSKYK